MKYIKIPKIKPSKRLLTSTTRVLFKKSLFNGVKMKYNNEIKIVIIIKMI